MATTLISAPKPSDDNLVAKSNSSRSFSARTKIDTNKMQEAKTNTNVSNAANANQSPQKTEAPKPSVNTQGQVTGTMINTIA